jgi:hypothetical protein
MYKLSTLFYEFLGILIAEGFPNTTFGVEIHQRLVFSTEEENDLFSYSRTFK